MTHVDWSNTLATGLAALAGGVGGSLIILWTTRVTNSLTKQIAGQDRKAQAELAADERREQAKFALEQRRLDAEQQRLLMARTAAAQLLEHVAEVIPVIPNLVGANMVQGVGPRAREVRNAWRQAVAAIVPLVNQEDIRDRCRELDRLLGELSRNWADRVSDRVRADVTAYARYIRWSLIQFIHGEEIPSSALPPVLNRDGADGSIWCPAILPPGWADGA